MDRLEALRKPLEKMTVGELQERVRQIREERKIARTPISAKRARKPREPSGLRNKLAALLEQLTPEQRAKLLEDNK